MELATGEESAYGYRKLAICLRRQHNLIINDKKVYRLCKELDILAPQRRIKVKHPRRLAANHQITASDQLWEVDLKYCYVAKEDRFFYLMSFIDVYDRMIVDYHLGYLAKGNMPPRSCNGLCGNGSSLKLTADQSSEAITVPSLSAMCSKKPV